MIHYIISIFIMFGSFFSKNKKYLKFHFFFNLMVIAHWYTNNNKCFLSDDYGDEDPQGYTKHLLSFLHIEATDSNANLISYLSVIIPASISLFRLKMH
jgi:hypothetical protein